MDRAIDIAIAAPVSRDRLVRQASDIADMARETGKTELEIQWLIKYLEMVPNDVKRWERLIVGLIDAGHADEARKQLANLLAKNPDSREAQILYKEQRNRLEERESTPAAAKMK
jgi:hypothetical protein